MPLVDVMQLFFIIIDPLFYQAVPIDLPKVSVNNLTAISRITAAAQAAGVVRIAFETVSVRTLPVR